MPAKPKSAYQKLTLKQRKFVEAYLGRANGNATEAGRIAGYAHPMQQGSETRQNENVQAAIEERLKEAAMSADEVLARLTEMGRGIGTCFWERDEDGRLRLKVDAVLEAGLGHLIHEVADTEHGQKIKFYDAQAALVQLGRYHKLFSERMEHTGPNGGPIEVKQTLDLTLLSDEELDALERLVNKADPDAEGDSD